MKNRIRLLVAYLLATVCLFFLVGIGHSAPLETNDISGMEIGSTRKELEGKRSLMVNDSDTIFVKPYLSLIVEPIDPLCDNFYTVRVCPYVVKMTLLVELSPSTMGLLDSIDYFSLSASLSVHSEAIPPPGLALPYFSANPNMSVFGNGGMELEGCYLPTIISSISSSDDTISWSPLSDNPPGIIDASSEQSITLSLQAIKDPVYFDYEFDQLHLYFGGIVVILEEVIDPSDSLVFSLDSFEAYSLSNSIPTEISIDSWCYRIIAGPVQQEGLFNFAYREFGDLVFSDIRIPALGIYPAFAVFQDSLKLEASENAFGASFVPHCPLYQGGNTLSLTETDGSQLVGFVDTSYSPGLFPLFKGDLIYPLTERGAEFTLPTKSYSLWLEEILLPPKCYSLCLDEIIENPFYYPSGILCYVLPPDTGLTPCPHEGY